MTVPAYQQNGSGNRYLQSIREFSFLKLQQRNTRCQCAVCYTDFWEAYEQVLPRTRHQAVAKETGKTSYIELADTLLLFKKQERTRRFNNTLRQRVGRLVRKTLSFSKKFSNHIGASWSSVHHYNALLRA